MPMSLLIFLHDCARMEEEAQEQYYIREEWLEMRVVRQIIQGLKNLWFWIPVIWNDRGWDEYYLFRLLVFKFKLMENFYNSEHAISADRKHVASKVRICRLLCERLAENDYDSMLDLEYHSGDFNDFVRRVSNGQKTVTCHTLGHYGDRWMKYEDYMMKQDVELLCRIMQKHILTWWD